MTKRARGLRANMTDAERLLWRELRKRQFGGRFRRQFPIPPYVVDFACVEGKLVVEADGGQHAQPGDHDYRDAELQRQGWRILRFCNNDIIANTPGVLQTIVAALPAPGGRNPRPSPPPVAGEGVSVPPRALVLPSPLLAEGAASSDSAASPPPPAGEGADVALDSSS